MLRPLFPGSSEVGAVPRCVALRCGVLMWHHSACCALHCTAPHALPALSLLSSARALCPPCPATAGRAWPRPAVQPSHILRMLAVAGALAATRPAPTPDHSGVRHAKKPPATAASHCRRPPRPAVPGGAALQPDELAKIAAVMGTPTAATWEEGLALAERMGFRFPHCPPVPLGKLVGGRAGGRAGAGAAQWTGGKAFLAEACAGVGCRGCAALAHPSWRSSPPMPGAAACSM